MISLKPKTGTVNLHVFIITLKGLELTSFCDLGERVLMLEDAF